MRRWWWGVLLGAGLVVLLTTAAPWRAHPSGLVRMVAATGWGLWLTVTTITGWVLLRERGLAWTGLPLLPGWRGRPGAVRDLAVFALPISPPRPPAPTSASVAAPAAVGAARRTAAPATRTTKAQQAAPAAAFVPATPSLGTYPARHPALTGPQPVPAAAVDDEDGFVPAALAALLHQPRRPEAPDARPAAGGMRAALGISAAAGVLTVDLLSRPGWAIDGPGRDGAVRALLAQLLLGRPALGNGSITPVISAGYAAHLGLARPETHGFAVAPTTTVTLRHLAAEITHRAGWAARLGPAAGLADLRAAFPDAPIPAVLAVLDDVAPDSGPVLLALLTRGAHLGVTGLVVGGGLAGFTVAHSGEVIVDGVGLELRRAFTLGAAPTRRLLTSRAHHATGEEVTIPLVGWQPLAPPALPAPRPAPPPVSESAVTPAAPAVTVGPSPAPSTTIPPTPAGCDTAVRGPRVVTFGRPHLADADGGPGYQGLLSMEIAAYLALHRAGASTMTLVERLLPDADPVRARNQIHQGIRRLRDACRQLAGDTIVIDGAKGGGYRLVVHTSAVCDLWEFQAALDAAENAPDDERIAALRRALGVYRGRWADGIAAAWAEGPAAALAARALDAARDLADLLADDDPADAVSVLEQALLHDPYSEAVHTHLMRLHAHSGRTADVRRVYHRLEQRLADLGARPAPATTDLLTRLLHPRTSR